MDVSSGSLRRIHTMAKEALIFVPASERSATDTCLLRGSAASRTLRCLAVLGDKCGLTNHNRATLTVA